MKKTLASFAAAAAVLFAPAAAQAQACTAATAMTSATGYLNCAGSFTGNLNGSSAELTQLTSLFGGTWTYQGKSDDANNGPFTSSPDNNSGTFAFDNLMKGKFVIGVKSATRYSFYLFDGGTAGILNLPYQTIGTAVNGQGKAQDLSHLALYKAPTAVVPEPSTYALLGTGLVGLAGMARRRRGAQA